MEKTTKKQAKPLRFLMYPDELLECLGQNPPEKTLSRIGISIHQWQCWLKSDGVWVAAAQYHLIQFHHRLNLAELLGHEWDGFSIHGNALEFPGLKRTVTAGELKALWYSIQRLGMLDSRADRLKAENERLTASLADAEHRASYYRQQLRLESTIGLMLTRVAL